MRTLSKRQQILINMHYKLLRFLIREKVLDKYLDNSSKPELSEYPIEEVISSASSKYHIIRAFRWTDSPEGWRFWDRIAVKYYYYIDGAYTF